MGSSEEGKSSNKSEKSPPRSTGTEQNNVHVYPDWAAMQAYYGPRVALPPYFNSVVASGHPPPPYMWPPQPMMSPYGAPYGAVYAHGGVYAHPAVPFGPQAHGHAAPSPAVSEAMVVTPLSMDVLPKSSGNADRELMKKLKGFDGLAMSIGNGNAEKAEDAAENALSQSAETEGSSDGSDGNTEEADQSKRKRSREGTPTNGADEKIEVKPNVLPTGQMTSTVHKVLGVPVSPATATGTMVPTVAPGMATTLELRNPGVNEKANPTAVSPTGAVLSSEAWLQNERELKRERRKQSNRESARRSRLRKQAETEELARRVDSLTAENTALKSEISQLVENSQKLRLENTALMEKLKTMQGQAEDTITNKVDTKRDPSDSTENLLSRVNNSGSATRTSEEGEYEKSSNSSTKLHQLLDVNRRADAVAAG